MTTQVSSNLSKLPLCRISASFNATPAPSASLRECDIALRCEAMQRADVAGGAREAQSRKEKALKLSVFATLR